MHENWAAEGEGRKKEREERGLWRKGEICMTIIVGYIGKGKR